MTELVLDTGALLSFERPARAAALAAKGALDRGTQITISAGCLAQAWRDGARQARLSNLLGAPNTRVVAVDHLSARRIGELLGARGTSDVVDGHVAYLAITSGAIVLTSDPDDLRRLAPNATIVAI